MMATGAFGDSLSGLVLAGRIAAAISHREHSGEAVEGSLLSTAMWGMQAATARGPGGGQSNWSSSRSKLPGPAPK